jgi:hypothetical protein
MIFSLSIFSQGDYETFVKMVLDGYDHIIDVTDADGSSIADLARSRGHPELSEYLNNVQDFVDTREKLLQAIRDNDIMLIEEILSRNDGIKLARAKNYYGNLSYSESNVILIMKILN